MLLCFPVFLFALPEGEQVVAGSAEFDRSQANALTVNTPSEKLIVNYNSFNIGQPETVRFNQPSASSVALNRVTGGDPSAILGTLSANGQVFIVNPNGIVFGPGSRVDVAGMVASTMNIADEDFLNGNYVFSQEGKGGFIINAGSITAQPGGFVVLLGQAVENKALIQADYGTVALASGKKATLSLENDSLISVVVDEAVETEVFGPDGVKMDSAVKNSGSILAQGGKVILTARILNKVFDYAINNTGLVQVTSLTKDAQGVLELVAEGAPIVNSGTLAADAVYIKVNDSVTNTATGAIIATPIAALNGGTIDLEAETVLQQGLVSANALEEGTAGEISIVSQGNTVLDENSATEARATGVVGNGGRITIDSKQGSVFVNKNGKIDFSAGSVAGNGGNLYIGAFEQLGFFGILNGRAPPGYARGIAFLDPEYAEVSGSFLGDTTYTVDAWRDITIVGDIFLDYNTILNLFADQQAYFENGEFIGYEWDSEYNPGLGAIINSGDFTITGDDWGGTLNLKAGSGIGSIELPVQTNVSSLSAMINPESSEGDIYIEQGNAPLEIGNYDYYEGYHNIYSPGLVVIMSSGPLYNGIEGDAIEADELYLEAIGGIDLWVAVRNLAVLNEGDGDVYIGSYGGSGLNILSMVNEGGEIEVDSAGDIGITYGIRASGDVTLNAYYSIHLSNFADIVGSNVYLTAQNSTINRLQDETLLGYWSFDGEDDYGYYVYDQVTGSYSYVYGATRVEGGVGGSMAMSFDGNDYINTYRYFNLGSGPFTLVVWYNGTQTAPYIGLVGATPGLNVGYTLENHNGYARYWLSREVADSAVPINDGAWHLISMVRDGTEGSLYVINEEEGEGSASNVFFTEFDVPADSVDSYVPFWIGGWGYTAGIDGQSRLTQGLLDDVRVYNRALSGLELYAQTLVAPGSGRISAGRVELYAENGVDMGFGTVNDYYVSTNSGDILIDSLSDLSFNEGNFDNHDYTTFTDGAITLITAGNLYINEDIYTIGDNDLTLTADGNIVLAAQVSVYSDSDYGENSIATALSGDVTLNAEGDIVFGRGASVYSNASGYSLDSESFASSGDISLTAGNNITMDWGRISSYGYAYGYVSCIAYSGDVVLSAGNNLTETGFGDLIYSSARANVYEESQSSAFASSGLVSLYAGNSMTIDGRDPEYTYGGDVYSYGYAYGGLSAVAYSSSVSLATGYGDISVIRIDVRSDADAQTFTADTPGTTSSAYARGEYYDYYTGEWVYRAVSIDAGGSILLSDNTLIYGSATAQGEAAHAAAQSGDVSLDARYAITLASHVTSDALTYAYDLTESYSGRVRLTSYYGPITVPDTALVFSNASSNVIGAGAAYATSDDVMVRCLYGPVTLNQSVSSNAEAYGDSEISPVRVEATSGDVSVGSGFNYVEYYTEIYGPDYYYDVGYYDPDEYYYGDALTLNGGYVYSYPHTSNAPAADLVFESGDIELYGETISLVGASVYTGAGSDEADPAIALNTAYVTAGNIGIYAAGNISLSGSSDITTRALASGPVGAGAMAANAVSGAISLRSEYGDITLGSAAALVYDLIQSYASATEAEAAGLSAVSGAVSLWAGSDILLLPSAYDYPVESLAVVGAEGQYPGDLISLTAMGDIELSQDLRADTISILADADWSGDGEIIQNADGLTLNATSFNISGAQDFTIDVGDYITINALGVTLVLDPGFSSVLGLSVSSSLEDTLTLNDPLYVDGYINLFSAGDLNVFGSLYADSIALIADYNENGYGDLFSGEGQLYLAADISHYLQSANGFVLIGDRVSVGESFDAILENEGPLGDLTIISMAGSVRVTDEEGEQLIRTGDAGIDIWAEGDIVLEAPVVVELGGLSLISNSGSIVAGEAPVHIVADSDVYLQAGNDDTEESGSVIGTLDAPLNIEVTGTGDVTLRVYGQQFVEEIETAVSGNLIGETPTMTVQVLNDAPGVVYFNDAPAPEPEPEPPEPPEPPYEPPEPPSPEEPESLPLPPAQPSYIDSYDPNPVDPVDLDNFQQNSVIGQFFLYHPLTETDMGAFDQFTVGPDAYQLSNGNLQFVGPEGLLQFFQEFEQKRKQSDL